MTDSGSSRRRRRRRPSGDPALAGPTRGVAEDPPPAASGKARRDDRADRRLAGAGPSQVGVDRALRARDVNRPSAAELAAAEVELSIVRRNWRPPAV